MWFSELIVMTSTVYENCIIMYSMLFQGMIIHLSLQEGNAKSSGGEELVLTMKNKCVRHENDSISESY